MDTLIDALIARFNYWAYIIIMMIGLHAMITKNNLIKKLIGMSIFQTAIILFFVSVGVKHEATIPIVEHQQESVTPEAAAHHPPEEHEGEVIRHVIQPEEYANPLPHVLMLWAIVVGVSTLGVGLAVVQKIHGDHGTLEESEILDNIKSGHG